MFCSTTCCGYPRCPKHKVFLSCLGCKICEKTCQHDAIKVVDNVASIDFEKCTGCGECAEKCPRKIIRLAK